MSAKLALCTTKDTQNQQKSASLTLNKKNYSHMKNILFALCTAISFSATAQVQQAELLGQWSDDENIVMVGWLQSRYNEVWGVAVNGSEIGIIGSTAGTHFIDVTDPTNPTETVLVEGLATGTNLVHRDYHDYGGYLYAVADEGNGGLEIIDLSGLPETAERVYASDEFIRRSHNIFIDEDHARLYAVAGVRGSGVGFDVMILDISDPPNPQLLASYNGDFNGVNFPNNHDIYVRDHIAYVNGGNNGLFTYDFTDVENPVLLTSLTEYPEEGYNHAGYLDEEGRYYYLLDETHGTDIKAIDVCDTDDYNVVKLFNAEATSETTIAHNALVKCDRLYVSYYYEGLQIYDISDPADPVRIYEYDTYPGPDEDFFAGAWGIYPFLPSGNILLSDLQTGLYVFGAIEEDCTYNVLADCDLTNDGAVATEELPTVTELRAFPQPATGEFFVSFTAENSDDVEFTLFDISGKAVKTFAPQNISGGENTLTFSLENTAAGLYFLEMKGETVRETVKIVVQQQ